MTPIRLQPGDEQRVERFLSPHADSSQFLLSNLRAAGLVFSGKPLEGTWVGAEENGQLVGVACHAWNGRLLLQAPAHAAEAARFALLQSGRKVTGLLGPWPQLLTVRDALGLPQFPERFSQPDHLYSLPLTELKVPAGKWECRRALSADLELAWAQRAAFITEVIGSVPGPEDRQAVERLIAEGAQYLLFVEGRPVASGCFNARLPDCVQLGGIYTPTAERNRGYARALVAGMLVAARSEGVTRAVLFTAFDNAAACRAYESIGFRRIGEYGLVLYG